MAKKQTPNRKNNKTPKSFHLQHTTFNWTRRKKIILIVIVSLLVIPVVSSIAYEKYKDYDNANFIRGLTTDFPLIVKDIEQATGLDLVIENNCQQTQEKFSVGKKTCIMSMGASTTEDSLIRGVIENYLVHEGSGNTTERYSYMGKGSCKYAYLQLKNIHLDFIWNV